MLRKLRAKIKENGKPKMFYQEDQYVSSFLRRVTSYLAFEHDGEDGRHESYLADYALEKCLEQSTGFLDKNGKEIYEGDIVSRTCLGSHCDLAHIGVVEYSTKWCTYGMNEKPGYEYNGYLPPLAYGDPIKGMSLAVDVLGSYYLNPELIKGRKL